MPPRPPIQPTLRTGRTTGLGWVLPALLAPIVVIVIVLAVFARIGDGISLPGAGPDDLPVAWGVRYDDLTSSYGTFGPVDGTVPGRVLTTSSGWVVMLEASTPDALLASLDSDSGDVQWSVPLPESRCTQRESGVDLVCLTRSGAGEPFDLVTLDVATGEITERVPTELTQVPWLAVALDDLVVTLSASGMLTALTPDGSAAWTTAADLDDLDLTYQEVDVMRYDGALLLYLGYAGTVHVTVEGQVLSLPCGTVAATPQAWVCESETDDETVGHAPDGTELWRGPWSDYYLVSTYQRIVPVVLAQDFEDRVAMVDPLTGVHGPALQIGDQQANLGFVGDAEHPVVTAEDRVVMLSADGTRILWEQPLDDEYLIIADSAVVGDVLVIDGDTSHGIDVVTGDELWERGWISDHFQAYDDDSLLVAGLSEIRRAELP